MDVKIILKIQSQQTSVFSMSAISSFKNIENKHDVYKGEDCMKNFYKSLREQAMEIINFKRKKLSY